MPSKIFEIIINLKLILGLVFSLLSLFIYIKIASKKGITSRLVKPSHSNSTILGGGIVFSLTFLYCLFVIEEASTLLILSVTTLMLISFIDDLKQIRIGFRLFTQSICVISVLFFYFTDVLMSIICSVILFFIYIAYINASNFMDGINGMLASHTIVTILALVTINSFYLFTEPITLYLLLFSSFLFSIGNFRRKPTFISGDVGSISLGFIIGFMILKFYFLKENLMIFSLMSFYLIDTGVTMFINIINRKSILQPHKEHFYEKLVFDRNFPDLKVSTFYSIIQIFISIVVIYTIFYQINSILFFISFNIGLVLIYIIFRTIIFGNELK